MIARIAFATSLTAVISTAFTVALARTHDLALDIFGAPLRRTVTLIGVAVGLGKTARRGAVVRLNTNGVCAGADCQNRDVELRQRRPLAPRT